MKRKDFLKFGALLTAGFGMSHSVAAESGALEAQGEELFKQQPLPYGYNQLEPYVDALTMELHYSKHAAAYCKNLNSAAVQSGIQKGMTLPDLMREISKYPAVIRNNGGGHFNHEFFWGCMQPGGSSINDQHLLAAVQRDFGSVDRLKEKFSEAALKIFGSGWAWLIVDAQQKLQIVTTPNQDNPLMDVVPVQGTPLLALDVWEHAYYLHYQNRRAEYIKNWWAIVNWNQVAALYG
ncbi:MAG: superoxide dismutase [Bacteroidetes bacterium]|nr:superoxide dismutase [Bacteroidota bacterium]